MLRTTRNKKIGNIAVFIGALLMIAALALTLFNFWDETRAEHSVEKVLGTILDEMENGTPEAPLLEPDWNVEAKMPSVMLNGEDYLGVLEIPSLELVLPIGGEWNYSDMRKTPCRYAGGLYEHNMVIAGHNYKSHFGQLSELNVGDEVFFTDMDKNRFAYRVLEIKNLRPTAINEMNAAGKWDLTLFTCTLGGRGRVAVRCAAQLEE